MSWKDDKDLGSWEFSEQPNKWGYLNNPRWSSQRNAVDFSNRVGNPIDPTDTHKPCGHWHKNPSVTKTIYKTITGWWWQPSTDVRDGIIGLVPMRYDNEVTDGIIGLVYDVAEGVWKSRGEVLDIAILYGEPNTCRLAEDYMAYFCTCSDGYPYDFNLMYSRLYIFEEGENPRYTDVWTTNYDTKTPYEVWDSKVYNVMDCVGDRIVCAALVWEIAGVTTNKWQLKISFDAGLTFDTEYLFDAIASSNDDVQVRMSDDGIIWVAYLRISSGATQNIELWKSNAAGTSFSKIWERAFYVDTSHKYPDLSIDVDSTGQYVTIGLFRTGYYAVIYSSDDYGSSFSVNIHTTFSPYTYTSHGIMASNGQYVVIPSGTTFQRSTDYGATFNEVDPDPIELASEWPDLQHYLNEFVYIQCGESFDDTDFQGIVYSDDNGAEWSLIQSPAANIEDPDGGYQEIIGGSETIDEPQVWPMD